MLTPKQHKELLDKALQNNPTFKSLGDEIPCRISLEGKCFNVYIRNLSYAHLGNEDVWRAQLPSNEKFTEMKISPDAFIFLGYDEYNDVYATWNPYKLKLRLNEAKYVSLYSRLSAQKEAHYNDEFIRKELNNNSEVLIFPRKKLNIYLENIQDYFPDINSCFVMSSKCEPEANKHIPNNTSKLYSAYYVNGKITKVTDPVILRKIEPHLNIEYKDIIVAMNLLQEFYSAKFDVSKMEIKDWMNLIKDIDWKKCYKTSTKQVE